jgi:hypothetical protein
MNKTVVNLDERALRTLNSVNEAKDAISNMESKYDFELESLRQTSVNHSDTLFDLTKRLMKVEEYLKPQMSMDIVPMINRYKYYYVNIEVYMCV